MSHPIQMSSHDPHANKGEGMHSKFSGEFENLPKQKPKKKCVSG